MLQRGEEHSRLELAGLDCRIDDESSRVATAPKRVVRMDTRCQASEMKASVGRPR